VPPSHAAVKRSARDRGIGGAFKVEKQVVIPGLTLYTIKGPKEIATIFTVGATGRITGVTVESHPGG
jgi:hypothetical protein